jgi:hypothetical protein
MHRAAAHFMAVLLLACQDPSPICVQQHGPGAVWIERPAANPWSVKLSETLNLLIRVEGDASLQVEFTEKTRSSEGWHLELRGPATQIPLDGDRLRWQQSFVATPLKPGSFALQLPALQFTQSNGKEQPITWELLPFSITTRVTKVDASEARDRSNIEELPPLPPATGWPWWPLVLAALPAGAVIALAARRWLGRPVVEPAPGEVALKELAELDLLTVHTAPEVKGLYTRLSDALRRYLEKRLGLPATQRTTAEFFGDLAKTPALGKEQQQMLADILPRCDLAKFAGIMPNPEEHRQAVDMARALVERVEAGLVAKAK